MREQGHGLAVPRLRTLAEHRRDISHRHPPGQLKVDTQALERPAPGGGYGPGDSLTHQVVTEGHASVALHHEFGREDLPQRMYERSRRYGEQVDHQVDRAGAAQYGGRLGEVTRHLGHVGQTVPDGLVEAFGNLGARQTGPAGTHLHGALVPQALEQLPEQQRFALGR